MTKLGRPGIPYEKFVEVWEQLTHEGRASINLVQAMLGGNKGTLAVHRERYEGEKTSKEQSLIKSIQLTEAVHRAIAEVKVQEIEALEKTNNQLKARIDDNLAILKETEEKLAAAQVDLEEAKNLLNVAQARLADGQQREQKLAAHNEQLNEQYNQAKQEAAVAKKEVEMLREEQAKEKIENSPP